MGSSPVGMSQVCASDVPRVCRPGTQVQRLVQALLSAATRAWERASRCRARASLQMDSYYLPLLEGWHALRRPRVREIAHQAGIPFGGSLEPAACGTLLWKS